MDATPLLLAIIGHLVGDYLLQNDWMALNKKAPGMRGSWACTVHSAVWSGCVVLFAGWNAWAFAALQTAHYWQDRTNVVRWWMTRPWKDQTQFVTGPCAPWSIIVVDNVWHIVSLWAVWRFLT